MLPRGSRTLAERAREKEVYAAAMDRLCWRSAIRGGVSTSRKTNGIARLQQGAEQQKGFTAWVADRTSLD